MLLKVRAPAFTRNSEWEERYNAHVPLLDHVLEKSFSYVGKGAQKAFLEQTDVANTKLIEIEGRSFALAKQGKNDKAASRLLDNQYRKNKALYAQSIDSLIVQIENHIEKSHSGKNQASQIKFSSSYGQYRALGRVGDFYL